MVTSLSDKVLRRYFIRISREIAQASLGVNSLSSIQLAQLYSTKKQIRDEMARREFLKGMKTIKSKSIITKIE